MASYREENEDGSSPALPHIFWGIWKKKNHKVFEEEKPVMMKFKDVFLKLFLAVVKFLGERHLSLLDLIDRMGKG